MSDDPVAFLIAQLDKAKGVEICGCYDTNHWPPCVPQPWKIREQREITSKRLLLAGHEGVHRCDHSEHCGGEFGPCGQVRALLLPYADEPGWHEEWMPSELPA